jgi:hypothetical protein
MLVAPLKMVIFELSTFTVNIRYILNLKAT